MKFNITFSSQDQRFAIGIEVESGKPFLAIPVSNRMVDYLEFYEISESEFNEMNLNHLHEIATLCRLRKNDEKLFIEPGEDRGDPS